MTGIMMAFVGSAGGVVSGSYSDSKSTLSPGTSTASAQWNPDGTVAPLNGPSQAWYNPPAVGTPGPSYYIKAVVTSGAVTSGSGTGTYLQLNTGRFWSVFRSGIGTNTAVLTIYIATSASDVDIVATSTLTLTATVTV